MIIATGPMTFYGSHSVTGQLYNLGQGQAAATTATSSQNQLYYYGYDQGATNAQVQYFIQHPSSFSITWPAESGNFNLETEKQRIARTAAQEEFLKKREAAEHKAEDLLLMFLTDDQKNQYKEKGYIEINSDKQNKFRIRKGWSKNVEKLDASGKPECIYCIHPGILVPTCDNMLAQKLMLETDEIGFISKANKWSV
jgi:hypothetical protein